MERREKKMVRHSIFKTFTVGKTLPLVYFPFFPMIPCRYHGKKREKIAWTFHFFSKPFQYGKPCLIFNCRSSHDTICTNHGDKREKYGQAFHFSKPPPQVDQKIS
jgi:hypothetical protein